MSPTAYGPDFLNDMDLSKHEEYMNDYSMFGEFMNYSEKQWEQFVAERMKEGEDDNASEQWEQSGADSVKEREDENTSEQLRHSDIALPTIEDENTSEQLRHPDIALPTIEDNPSSGPSNEEQQRTGGMDVSYSIVFARLDGNLEHIGPRRVETDILHISDPGAYAPIPENVGNEMSSDTNEEEIIKRQKPTLCSARIQFDRYWAVFHCTWQTNLNSPVAFVDADRKDGHVSNCKIKCLWIDDRYNVLLGVEMMVWRDNNWRRLRLCCKRIVGNEDTQLTPGERDYVLFEEQRRVF